MPVLHLPWSIKRGSSTDAHHLYRKVNTSLQTIGWGTSREYHLSSYHTGISYPNHNVYLNDIPYSDTLYSFDIPGREALHTNLKSVEARGSI